MHPYAIFLIAGIFLFKQGASQCAPPVTACETGTPLTDGAQITTGQTFSCSGSGRSFSDIYVNGGTLLLCSAVTISNLTINRGTLVINAGATANVNGTLTIFNNGSLINNGSAVAGEIVIGKAGAVCLGSASSTSVRSITNNQANAITVPFGSACLSYSSAFGGDAAITTNANLFVCQLTGALPPVPVAKGNATFTANCAGCMVLFAPLPVTLVSFKGKQSDNQAILEWETAAEDNVQSYIIERSFNGARFNPIGEVKANKRAAAYTFTSALISDNYFRLKITDPDGRFTYSSTVIIKPIPRRTMLYLLGNPVNQPYLPVIITTHKGQKGELQLIDMTGRMVKKWPVTLGQGSNTLQVDLHGLLRGPYYLHYINDMEEIKPLTLLIR